MNNFQNIKLSIKAQDNLMSKFAYNLWHATRHFTFYPAPSALYYLHLGMMQGLGWLVRVFYWTPLFQSRLDNPAKGLYIYGGMPQVLGALKIQIGANCRISAQTTFTGRTVSATTPFLKIGNNVGISWQTTIAVGRKVIIGDHVRIAGRCFLGGYPGHPFDAQDRAAGKSCTENQIGNIILEDNVWLASGVTVLAGVTIGAGSVIATGSVVTKDIPANVLAAGMPAKVIRPLINAADTHQAKGEST